MVREVVVELNEKRTEVSKQIQSAVDDCTGDARRPVALRNDGESPNAPLDGSGKDNVDVSPLLDPGHSPDFNCESGAGAYGNVAEAVSGAEHSLER